MPGNALTKLDQESALLNQLEWFTISYYLEQFICENRKVAGMTGVKSANISYQHLTLLMCI